MNKSNLVVLLAIILLLSSCSETKGQKKAVIDIAFTKANKLDFSFIGHGVQWSAYPHADSKDAEWGFLMTNEKWEELYKRLDFVKPNIIRVMDVSTWRYYKGLDKNKQPILDFNTQEIKSLYKLLDYCQDRKIKVLFGEWGAPGLWNLDETIPEIERADDPRWIGMIVKYLKHLILEKGYTCIQYYNLVNEPNGYWASTDGDWEQWKSGYIQLNKALKTSGLHKYVSLSGPDAVTQWNHPSHPKKAHDWVYSTVTDLDSITGLYDFHIYADQDLIRTGNFVSYLEPFTSEINKTKKPLVLGELGMKYSGALKEENRKRGEEDSHAGPDDSSMFVYDYFYGVDMADAAIQSMLAGVGGTIAWDLDDAMHTVGDLGEKNQLKKWGMWNILAEEFGDLEVDKKPRPWSYTWTLLCNLFPPESTIYKPEFSIKNDSIRSVAMTSKNQFTMALVNQSKSVKNIHLETDLLEENTPLYLYEYSEINRPINSEGFPIVSKNIEEELTVEVKSNSVIFLSTIVIK
ncbi:cellulase (glycosyl hydrolase family 5) [Maribacter vaceletii]|uniref:Cellulase (Glycosyl hydrolase family 5) n=1 Tax=Maribacter vaceletii TaxID=1206816 RepID=A0A495EDN9_9FLAO|nr:cellulase family glycosylhydrolase [Maribacter vaceletii]RKR14916.1 cellulase (glycosyl hydrolase family 5) [Maribacter vaceletii]